MKPELMSHADRRKLIEKPFPHVFVSKGRTWGGVIRGSFVAIEGQRSFNRGPQSEDWTGSGEQGAE